MFHIYIRIVKSKLNDYDLIDWDDEEIFLDNWDVLTYK